MSRRDLVYELLKSALWNDCTKIQNQDSLQEAFQICKQQGVLGVAFQGLQKFVSAGDFQLQDKAETTYLQWMGISAKLMQNREAMLMLQGRLHDVFRE